MKKMNQSGVAPLAILLIVVIVAVLGFAGWRVFGNKTEDNSSNSTINTLEVRSEDKSEPIEGTDDIDENVNKLEENKKVATGPKLGKCVDFRKDANESMEEASLSSELSSMGYKVYSVNQRCDMSDGSQLVAFKVDKGSKGLPPALAYFPEDKAAKARSTEFNCRALGGEGAHLTVKSISGKTITAVCESGHMNQMSRQTFEINIDTFQEKLVKDTQS